MAISIVSALLLAVIGNSAFSMDHPMEGIGQTVEVLEEWRHDAANFHLPSGKWYKFLPNEGKHQILP
jgi:hypothetical protein